MTNPILAGLSTTVFEEMSQLARVHGAINLGQGFPDEDGPLAIRQAAANALIEASNQYPSMRGTIDLRRAIAAHYLRRQGLKLDPEAEITVTSGATEALACAFFGLIAPGDEVVMFQPLYDTYAPVVRMAGGVPRLIALGPPYWRFTDALLAAAFNARTRLVVLNTPNNPTGSVTTAGELALLADYCRRFDVIAVCDEVWEQVVFEPAQHTTLMAMPGMRERCVKIGSAGKLFALTGWKVGWLLASPEITALLSRAHQYLTFTTAPNLQAAVAYGLENSDAWFAQMPEVLARSRDRLASRLKGHGFHVLTTYGTYFLTVDLVASGLAEDDRSFCVRAVTDHGVAAIPISAFYETDPVRSVIRLCFAKRDETLDEGAERLARARG